MVLNDVFIQMGYSFIQTIPNVFYAAVVLLIGLFLGGFMGKVTKKALEKLKADKLFGDNVLKISMSSIGKTVVSWVIYLIFLQQATVFLNVHVISMIVNDIILFIPNIVGMIGVILLTYLFGMYLKDKIIGSAKMYTKLLGDVIFFLVLYIGISTALPLVGINTDLISQLLLLVVGGLSLGIAVAVGLGMKDTVAKVSAKYFDVNPVSKKKKK